MSLLPNLTRRVPIQVGDSLSNLAHQHLGDYRNWREIAAQNGIDIFEDLPLAEQISIPSADELKELAREELTELANDVLDDLDLSEIKGGDFPWQKIKWLL